jgi:hypothetical protein
LVVVEEEGVELVGGVGLIGGLEVEVVGVEVDGVFVDVDIVEKVVG